MGGQGTPEVAPARPGGSGPGPLWGPGTPARPRIPGGAGKIGMDGGEKGLTGLEKVANTPRSTGLWDWGSSEPVTNGKSVLGEEGGGAGGEDARERSRVPFPSLFIYFLKLWCHVRVVFLVPGSEHH